MTAQEARKNLQNIHLLMVVDYVPMMNIMKQRK